MKNSLYHAQIMLIDDSPSSIEVAISVLRQHDYQIRIATSAATAMHLLTRQLPDIILLDVNMPDIDGFTFCRQLKNQPDYKDIPIIFLTASDDESSIQTAFDLGAQDYVTKPFKTSELLARVKTHIKLRQQQQDLQRAYDELNTFCSTISHDLKSPLLSLGQLASFLQTDYEDILDPNGRELITTMQEKAQEVIGIIDHLLEFSRAARMNLTRSSVDMTALVRTVYKECSEHLAPRRIDFTTNILPVVKADPVMLKLLLHNILSNAIKYTKKKCVSSIDFSCSITNTDYVFCCKDNGAGFDMRYADRLFQVFQRLHSSREFPGNGVGLAICQRIIQRHNGRIWLKSGVNKGTSCWFTLPK